MPETAIAGPVVDSSVANDELLALRAELDALKSTISELDQREIELKAKEFDFKRREKSLDTYEAELDERKAFLDERDKVMQDIGTFDSDADVKAFLKRQRKANIAHLAALAKTAKSEKLRYECVSRMLDMDMGKAGTKKHEDTDDSPGAIMIEKGRFHD